MVQETLGTLTKYATRERGFHWAHLEDGLELAAHNSIAAAAIELRSGLQIALDSTTVIGQATGMLWNGNG